MRRWNWRLVAAGIALVAVTALYLLLLERFRVAEQPREQSFGDAAPMGEVLIRPTAVDALNRTMQVGVYLSPRLSGDPKAPSAAERDLVLVVAHDRIATDVKLAAGGRLAVATFETELEGGSVADYPLDAYRARIGVGLVDAASSSPLPVRVTVWEGLLGFDVHARDETRDGQGVGLTIAVVRSGAVAMFAVSAYGAMVVLAACALSVAFLTFGTVRRAEASLIGALAAMTFALPTFRNALPGAPPLGVQADLWIFLWAELAVVLALALLVFRWSRSGPPP